MEKDTGWAKQRPAVHVAGSPSVMCMAGWPATPRGVAKSSGLDDPGPRLLCSQEPPRAPQKLTSSLRIFLGHRLLGARSHTQAGMGRVLEQMQASPGR